ncbi:MAG: DNA alkylation repair protein [Candidatus Aenigmarchaeota archaeon CG_4_10_14_0_8_um_filter_37_24]|nr:DNA alkylation repair protein [Candidatus Aenigmarchaeota archaeon]OIN86725.1 MAG: DNA alkylation repair protein [Candidatus Aenigmarchaeota archaeon CG1_02_38_14]PIV68099.1 MAG: DNA alkylation repair protein [Candidatus Aenigmarchaeota archaeon CG01_land_8_20_14_3_00_37_9]PIW40945.1 MAG: DNA alkylation repair protein [Candidatus Aenigmarchaeota archaeon CG15_BIG_FIL_POST_REV_8_21_14_020_37_27]PIX50743.1 MAG: DNA alkylation repair protein [Candidatus Aenigmarchaeota archaeon CG_4_8_14_3_um_f
MEVNQIIQELKKHSNPKDREGMAKFGINPDKALGVRIPVLRKLAKQLGKNHTLAQQLWDTEIHEARILASMVDDPKLLTEKQIDKWSKDFNSWDLCDQCCMNLFEKLPSAFEKAIKLTDNEEEFVRRTGFALMACLAWHDKTSHDEEFLKFFPAIKKYSTDDRNFVKKAVNWALRNIGKRSVFLNKESLKAAKDIQKLDSKTAKWIASDAIRELEDPKIQKRLK